MADVGHVHPDLVGAARFQTALYIIHTGIALQHRPMGHGVPSAGHHSHFLPIRRAAADGSVHRPGILPKIAGDDAAVGPGQRVILKLLRQFHMGEVVFCGDDETGGVPVNAVDDAGPQFSVDPGKTVPAVIQQGVHQCPVRVSRCGVDYQGPSVCSPR